MGEVVFWTIIRTAVIITVIWAMKPLLAYGEWWMIGIALLYVGIIHPAVIHYNLFMAKNKPVFEGTLCSSCKHFDTTAVLCMKYDEHPTVDHLPCDGLDWEPSGSKLPGEDIE